MEYHSAFPPSSPWAALHLQLEEKDWEAGIQVGFWGGL